jgi:spermidine/putrescine transport system permease protein
VARLGRVLLLAGPVAWVVGANIAPLIEIVRVSLLDVFPAPPDHLAHYSLDSYAAFLDSPIYRASFWHSIALSAVLTCLALLLTYPLAYLIALKIPARHRARHLLLLIAPFWTSEIVRAFAMMLLLANHGPVNELIRWLGTAKAPLPLLYNQFSVGFGMLYAVLLAMLLPLYAALSRLPTEMLQAAANLGAGPWTRLVRVTLPLTRDGIAAGCALVFLTSLGAFAVPTLLGGADTTLFSMTVGSIFASSAGRWPMGAAFGLILLLSGLGASGVIMRMSLRHRRRDEPAQRSARILLVRRRLAVPATCADRADEHHRLACRRVPDHAFDGPLVPRRARR